MKKFDAIVIGSGLGGMSAAATLAKKGYKVQVIEPHDKVGGFATSYRRGKYRMEAGIHVLGAGLPNTWANEFYDFLEIKENVPWVQLENFYECRFEGKSFQMPANLQRAHEALVRDFPHERAGIDDYFKLMIELTKHFEEFIFRRPFIPATSPLFAVVYSKWQKYWKVNVGFYLNGVMKDPALKAILLANVTFYHDNPFELSLVIYMLSQFSYYVGGCHFIKGGSQTYSNYLRKIVEDNGGEVLTLHEVFHLKTSGNQITSVCYRKLRGDRPEFESTASAIFVNAAIPLVKNWLADPSEWSKHEEKISQHGRSVSFTTLNLGLHKPLKELGSRDYMSVQIEARNNQLDLSRVYQGNFGVLDYNFYDDINPFELVPKGRFMIEAMYADHMQNWAQVTLEEYDKVKEAHIDFMVSKLESEYPGVRQQIAYAELGTPRTIVNYVHQPEGVVYGYSPSPAAIESRSHTFQMFNGAGDKVYENMFYNSAWSFLPGFLGCNIAGYKAVLEAEQKGILRK